MKVLTNKTIGGYALLISALCSLIGLIFYIVTSTTGYLAGSRFDVLPIVFSIIALAIGIVLFIIPEKLNRITQEILLFALLLLLIASALLFLQSRVELAADVWFIPVNYPASEETALNISIVGVVFYILAVVATIVTGFFDRIIKE